MHRGVVFLWSALAAVLLTVGGILGLLFMMQTRAEPVPEASAAATSAAATSAPAQTPDANYEAFIFNATSDDSRGEAMKAQLEALGWPADRVHLPASNDHDYPQTALVYASEEDAEYARTLAGALGIETVEQSDAYAGLATEPGFRSIAIVLGNDAQ